LVRASGSAVQAKVVVLVLPEEQTTDRRLVLNGGQAGSLDHKIAGMRSQQARRAPVDAPEIATVGGVDLQPVVNAEGTIAEWVLPDPMRRERPGELVMGKLLR